MDTTLDHPGLKQAEAAHLEAFAKLVKTAVDKGITSIDAETIRATCQAAWKNLDDFSSDVKQELRDRERANELEYATKLEAESDALKATLPALKTELDKAFRETGAELKILQDGLWNTRRAIVDKRREALGIRNWGR